MLNKPSTRIAPYRTLEDGQIAKAIYLKNMAAMKQILTIEEVRLNGRESKSYILFKKQVMDEFYNPMTEIFAAMELDGVLKKCQCGTSIRQGYKTCPHCNGAGYCNSDQYDDFVKDMKAQRFEDQPPLE